MKVLIFCGAVLGVIANLKIVGVLQVRVRGEGQCSHARRVSRRCGVRLQVKLPLTGSRGAGTILLALPCMMLGVALVIGAALAGAEGWSIKTGFLYLVSAMCGLGNPLTPITPTTTHGKLVAIVCACWQMALGGTIIGLSGAAPCVAAALTRLEQLCFRVIYPHSS